MTTNQLSEKSQNPFSQISEFETVLGFKLPTEYLSFLLIQDKKKREWHTLEFTGVDGHHNSTLIKRFFFFNDEPEYDLETNYHFFSDSSRIPKDILPIAEDIGGNLICLGLNGVNSGRIYFLDHELELKKYGHENLALLSLSFDAFTTLLQD